MSVKKATPLQVAQMKGHLYEEVDGWYVFFGDNRIGPFVDKDMGFNYYKMLSGESDKLV